MIEHDGVSYEYQEKHGFAYVHVDGRLTYFGARRNVMWAMRELPLVAILKLSIERLA